MNTIPNEYAKSWINTLFAVDPILTKARLGQEIEWKEAITIQIALERMRNELMTFAVIDVAVETREAA